jgi:hypothetical protein
MNKFFKKIIGQKNIRKLRRWESGFTYLFSLRERNKVNDLQTIGERYGAFKSYHLGSPSNKDISTKDPEFLSYCSIYEHYFSPMRELPINFLEIGVKNGMSLRTWKQYFNQGNIYGIDIEASCKALEEDRVSIQIGAQEDKPFLTSMFSNVKEFDVIIDDGSHVNKNRLCSFNYLFFNRLKSGGIYSIEGLINSYDSYAPHSTHFLPHKKVFNKRIEIEAFLNEKIKECDHLEGEVLSIHIWPSVCILIKK